MIGVNRGCPVIGREALDHLLRCRACRGLIALLDNRGKSEDSAEGLLARIETRLRDDLKPVRPMPSHRVLLFTYALVFLCVATLGASPFSMSGWHALSAAQRIGVFGTMIASATLLAISVVGQMSPGSGHRLPPARLPAAISAALLLAIAAAFRPGQDLAFLSNSMSCLRSGLTYSLLAAVALTLIARSGAMLHPTLAGATLGALAGLNGFAVLEINCTSQSVFHILAGHWGVILISLGVGALMGATAEYRIGRS